MGAGIVAVALRAGHAVYLHDTRQQALTQGAESVTASLDRWVKRGYLTARQRDECLARLTLAAELSELSACALVVEAIIENLEIKQQLFSALEAVVGEHTILASNTSSISITAIAATLQRPQRMVGMHFFNPATVLPLVEVVKGEATCATVVAQVSELATQWGKCPVECKSTPGFIVNRVARPFYAEALLGLEDQVAPAAVIDAALRDAGGFRMGPLELMDLIGHDTNFAVTRSIYDAFFQHNTMAAMFALTLASMGLQSMAPIFWSMPTGMLGGVAAAAGIALINSIGNLAGFFSPYLVGWIKTNTGTTASAMYIIAGFVLMAGLVVVAFVRTGKR